MKTKKMTTDKEIVNDFRNYTHKVLFAHGLYCVPVATCKDLRYFILDAYVAVEKLFEKYWKSDHAFCNEIFDDFLISIRGRSANALCADKVSKKELRKTCDYIRQSLYTLDDRISSYESNNRK